jgi:hypothetical protein
MILKMHMYAQGASSQHALSRNLWISFRKCELEHDVILISRKRESIRRHTASLDIDEYSDLPQLHFEMPAIVI